METATMEMEQKQVIETEISPMLDRVRALVVKTPEQRAIAVSAVKSLKELRERIEERFHPTANKKKIYAAYEASLETEHAFYDNIDASIDFVAGKNGLIKTYDTAVAIKAREDAELAEAKRRDDEAKAAQKLEAQAQKAEEKGNTAKAETLREMAQAPVIPSFAPPPAATKKLIVKARVTNLFKLCKLIVNGDIPFSVIEVKQSELSAWAKNQDPKAKFDGIEIYEESAGRI